MCGAATRLPQNVEQDSRQHMRYKLSEKKTMCAAADINLREKSLGNVLSFYISI